MESQNVEYKQSWKDEYLKWICGFANAQGGTIYIGIDDNGKVVGVDDAKKLMEDIPNKIVNYLGIVNDVDLLNKDGKAYIRITVIPSNTPISYHGKLYYRSGSTLQELSDTAAQNFLLRKMGTTWDSQIVEHSSLNDIDTTAVEYFLRKGVDNGRLTTEAKNDSLQKILANLRLVDNDGRLTMAALMLFGKDPQQFCLNARFKIGRFGRNGGELFTQDLIEGNLIQMADKIMSILSDKYLIRPIHYEGLQRIEPLEIPELGLRELIYNAIIHKSYDGPDIQMKVFDDRITLWNYGMLPDGITVTNMFSEHSSMPRNRLIANTFYLAGFIEAWGRGFETVADSFRKEELEVPTFKEEFGGLTVTIKREIFMEIQRGGRIDDKTGRIVKDDDSKNVAQSEGKESLLSLPSQSNVTEGKENGSNNVVSGVVSLSQVHLTERQKRVCEIIENNPFVSSKQMSVVLSVNSRTVQRDLAILQKNGVLIREGNTSAGRWVLTNRWKDTFVKPK